MNKKDEKQIFSSYTSVKTTTIVFDLKQVFPYNILIDYNFFWHFCLRFIIHIKVNRFDTKEEKPPSP